MSKVIIDNFIGTHDYAQCQDCKWDSCGITQRGDTNKRCKRHVEKTGHTIHREIAKIKYYSTK